MTGSFKRQNVKRRAAVGLSMLASCASSSPTPVNETSGEPVARTSDKAVMVPPPGFDDRLKELLEREVDLSEDVHAYETLAHSGTVLGRKLVDVWQRDDFTHLKIDIGTRIPIECFVYDEPLDLAHALKAGAGVVIEEWGKAKGGIQIKKLLGVKVGTFGRRSFLAADWVFRTNDPKGAFSIVKIVGIATKNQASLCHHAEPGYEKTFRKWVGHFARNYRHAKRTRAPRAVLVTRNEINNKTVGFTQIYVTEDSDGDLRIDTKQALLLEDRETAFDWYSVVFADKDGMLINLRQFDTRGTDLTVVPVEAGYHVSGNIEGRKVESHLATDSKIATEVVVRRRQKDAVQRAGQQEFTLPMFNRASTDRIVKIRFREQPPDAEGRIPIISGSGPNATTALFRSPYTILQVVGRRGPSTVKTVVLHQEGEF